MSIHQLKLHKLRKKRPRMFNDPYEAKQKLQSSGVILPALSKSQNFNKNFFLQQNNPNLISLTINLPVYYQYRSIKLQKNSQYQRIPRCKTVNNIDKQIQSNRNFPMTKKYQLEQKNSQRQIIKCKQYAGKNYIQAINSKDMIFSLKNNQIVKSHNKKIKRSKTQNEKDDIFWKQQIRKYMQIKQKSIQKICPDKGFPLMKLTRNNQIRRKIMTYNQHLDLLKKPQYIIQQQDIFNQNYSRRINKLSPKIKQQNGRIVQGVGGDLQEKNQHSSGLNKQLGSRDRILQVGHSQQYKIQKAQFKFKQKKQNIIDKQRQQKLLSFRNQAINSQLQKAFFSDKTKKANKNEKILINFIGKYFKQKFSPQKRFSIQKNKFSTQPDIHIQIRKYDS